MWFKRIAGLLLLSGVGTGCVTEPAATPEPERQVVARIGGEPVYRDQFEAYRRILGLEDENLESSATEPMLFAEFIYSRLLQREAERWGITVGQAEVEQVLADWSRREESLEANVEDEIYRYLVAVRTLKERALRGLEVSLAEMQSYYREHAEEFQVGDQAHVLEILVPTREEAELVLERMKGGDLALFRTLAREFSLGATAQQGGDLGYFTRGELPPEFERIVFALKPGEVSAPLESESGFHIFALEELIPAHEQRFYEVQDVIFDRLMAEKEREAVERFLRELYCASQVEIVDMELGRELREIECHEEERDAS
ncbi:MAG: peptidylprolyl isomerase [Acidobacteriota bacterium]